MTLQFTETAPGVHTGSVTDPRTQEIHNVAIIESCNAWQVFVDGEPKYRDLPSFREAVATVEQSASASKRSFPVAKLVAVVTSLSLLGAGSFAAAKFLDSEAAGLGEIASKARPGAVVERSTSKPTRFSRVNYAAKDTNSAYAPAAGNDTTPPSAYSAGNSLLGPKAETPDLTGQPESTANADPSVETPGPQSTYEPFKPRLVPMETAPSSEPVAVAVPSLQDFDRDKQAPKPSLTDADGSESPRREASQPLPVARPATRAATKALTERLAIRPSVKTSMEAGKAAREPRKGNGPAGSPTRPGRIVVGRSLVAERDEVANDKDHSRPAALSGRVEAGSTPARNRPRTAPARTTRKSARKPTRSNLKPSPRPRRQAVRLPVSLERVDGEAKAITITVQPRRESVPSAQSKRQVISNDDRPRTVRRKATRRARKVSHKRLRVRSQRNAQVTVADEKVTSAHKKTVRWPARQAQKAATPARKLHRVRKPVRAVRKPIRRYRKSVRALRQPANRRFEPRQQMRMVCIAHSCKFR